MSANLAQFGGITQWAVINVWGEGNMQGLNFVVTNNPIPTVSGIPVNVARPNTQSLSNWYYMDNYMDNQPNVRIYQQTQQTNYAQGGGGAGNIVNLNWSDQTIPARYPLLSMYSTIGSTNAYTYAGNAVSPGLSYAQALLPTLPANTGIIICPTMNFNNGTSAGFGIQSWLSGATPVAIAGATASLFYNVAHVISTALTIPGAYLHSHVCLMGETDVLNNALTQDQFSYYLNQFFSQLDHAVGANPGVPIVFGDMQLGWLATQANGVNNQIATSIRGIANRYRNAAFVESYVNPAIGATSGQLATDNTTLGFNAGIGAYYSAPSSRTLGSNLYNYGYASLPQKTSYTVPPVTNVVASSTSATNITLSWTGSANASAYDYLVVWFQNGLALGRQNTLGVTGITITGLTAGLVYGVMIFAQSDWGLSTAVTLNSLTTGNQGTEISTVFSSFSLSRTLAPSDNATQIIATLTLRNTANQSIIGYNTGLFQPVAGLSSLNNVVPGAANIGNAQATDVNGQAVWDITCANTLATSATSTYALANLAIMGTVTMTFGNPAVQSAALSALTASSTTTPADGTTSTSIVATIISLGGTAIAGFAVPQLIGTGSVAQVYFTPGSNGGPGNAQTANGAGQATWTLKSGNYIGGNPSLTLSVSGINQTEIINFAAQVAVANVDFIIFGTSASTPNTGASPSVVKGDYSTPVTGVTAGAGLPSLVYTSDTINGVTKNWLDTTNVQQQGNGHNILQTLPGILPSFSYSFWMKMSIPASLPGNSFTILFSANSGGPPNNNFRTIYMIYGSGPPITYTGMALYVGTNGSGTPYANPTGAWHHFVLTYNNNAPFTVNMYMDGNPAAVASYTGVATGNTGGFAPNNSAITQLGSGGSGQPMVPAHLADLVQYNIALTPTQVVACYNSWFLNP